jgi:hypothetical protein
LQQVVNVLPATKLVRPLEHPRRQTAQAIAGGRQQTAARVGIPGAKAVETSLHDDAAGFGQDLDPCKT